MKAPTWSGIRYAVDFTTVIPAPPFSIGDARRFGSQKKSPQYANWRVPASRQASSVLLRSSGPNRTRYGFTRVAPDALCAFHMSGSGTLRDVQRIKSAGSPPIAKSQRQALGPSGSTSRNNPASAAARIAPIAQVDCIRLVALLRTSAGSVSVTSTPPDAHSPPMPSPRSVLQIASCTTFCDVAAPSEQIEKIAIVMLSAFTRPILSAITPKASPPAAALSRVIVPSRPAVASPNPKYVLRCPIANV